MTFDERHLVASPTGAALNLLVTRAQGPARGVVQINHGVAEHAMRYARFARFLSARGFDTYAHDHRGHGHTKAEDAPLGHFGPGDAVANVIADVAAIHDMIGQERPGLPVIAFGHSMGALITLNFLFEHSDRVTGAAIWNGNFSAGIAAYLAKLILAWEKFRTGSDMPSRLLPKLTFDTWSGKISDGRTPFDWLSRDTAEVDAYVADPLCGFLPSVGMWQGIFEMIATGADDRQLARIRRDLPLNLLGGDMDPATDFGRAVTDLSQRLKRAGFSNLVSTIYPQTRHESLNELNHDLIMENFAGWAEGVMAGPSPDPRPDDARMA